jgi:formylglycine-generating enzyme required for sulfatase activity
MQTIEFETPTLDRQGRTIARTRCTAQQIEEDLGSTRLELVRIPAGSFQMGSLPGHGHPDERPAHFMAIRSFLLGDFPITQAQWKSVMGRLPPCRFKGDGLPVEQVSWNDAEAFCRQLSRRTGHRFRLPSEAEWEYACRAGTTTPFHLGETITTEFANYVGEHRFAEESSGLYRHCTTERGLFPPNAFGLYDMHGNVWEWCADGWLDDYSSAPRDGSAYVNRTDDYRVARGGSWHEPPQNCRSAVRIRFLQDEGDQFLGFRVAADA